MVCVARYLSMMERVNGGVCGQVPELGWKGLMVCVARYLSGMERVNGLVCVSRYVQVLPGEVCCVSPVEDRVSVGQGDSCCAGVPYSSAGSQMCCGGTSSSTPYSQNSSLLSWVTFK